MAVPDAYLRGVTLHGEHIHAVLVRADPHPLGHGHGVRRALCGLRCENVRPIYFPPASAIPPASGTRLCGTCRRLLPAGWAPPSMRLTGDR